MAQTMHQLADQLVHMNACFIVDPNHQVLIGPPPAEERQTTAKPDLWLIIAYTLDIVLVFVLAFFFRIHIRRNGGRAGAAAMEQTRLSSILPGVFNGAGRNGSPEAI